MLMHLCMLETKFPQKRFEKGGFNKNILSTHLKKVFIYQN